MEVPIVTIIGDRGVGKSRQFAHLTQNEPVFDNHPPVYRPAAICGIWGVRDPCIVFDSDSSVANVDLPALYASLLADQRQKSGDITDAGLSHSAFPNHIYSLESVDQTGVPVPRSNIDPICSASVVVQVIDNTPESIARVGSYWIPLQYLLQCHHQALVLVMECVSLPHQLVEYCRLVRVARMQPLLYEQSSISIAATEFSVLRQCSNKWNRTQLCKRTIEVQVNVIQSNIKYPLFPLLSTDVAKSVVSTESVSTSEALINRCLFSPLRRQSKETVTVKRSSSGQLETAKAMDKALRSGLGPAPWCREVSSIQLHPDVLVVIARCLYIADADNDLLLNFPELVMFCDMFLPEHVRPSLLALECASLSRLELFFKDILIFEVKNHSLASICEENVVFACSSVWSMLSSTYLTHRLGGLVLEANRLTALLPEIPKSAYLTLSSDCVSVLIQHYLYYCEGGAAMTAEQFNTAISQFPSCVAAVCRELVAVAFPLTLTQWIVFQLKLTQVDPVLILHVLQCIGYTGDARLFGAGDAYLLSPLLKYPITTSFSSELTNGSTLTMKDSSIVTRNGHTIQKTQVSREDCVVVAKVSSFVKNDDDENRDSKQEEMIVQNNTASRSKPPASTLASLQSSINHFVASGSRKGDVHFQAFAGLLQHMYVTTQTPFRSIGMSGTVLHAHQQCLVGFATESREVAAAIARACPVLPCSTRVLLHTRALVLGSPGSGRTTLCSKLCPQSDSRSESAPGVVVAPVLPFLPTCSITEPKQGASTLTFPSTPPCVHPIDFHTKTGAKVCLSPNVPFLSSKPQPVLSGSVPSTIVPSYVPMLTLDEVVRDPVNQIRLCMELAGHAPAHAYNTAMTWFPENMLDLDSMMCSERVTECGLHCNTGINNGFQTNGFDLAIITINVTSMESILFGTLLQALLPPQLPRVVLATFADSLPNSLHPGLPAQQLPLPQHSMNLLTHLTTPRYLSSLRAAVNCQTTSSTIEIFQSLFPFETVVVPVDLKRLEPCPVVLTEQGLCKIDVFKYQLDSQTRGLHDKLLFSRLAAVPCTPEQFLYKQRVVEQERDGFTKYIPYAFAGALLLGVASWYNKENK